MPVFLKRLWSVIKITLTLLVALFLVALIPKFWNMKSEYVTAGTISNLEKYVETHNGKWPTCWKDLGDGTDLSKYTRFRFDLTSEGILQNPNLIYQAVTPHSGVYYTYPHAEQRLKGVLKKVQEFHTAGVTNKIPSTVRSENNHWPTSQ